jgi:hypothetical protein
MRFAWGKDTPLADPATELRKLIEAELVDLASDSASEASSDRLSESGSTPRSVLKPPALLRASSAERLSESHLIEHCSSESKAPDSAYGKPPSSTRNPNLKADLATFPRGSQNPPSPCQTPPAKALQSPPANPFQTPPANPFRTRPPKSFQTPPAKCRTPPPGQQAGASSAARHYPLARADRRAIHGARQQDPEETARVNGSLPPGVLHRRRPGPLGQW